jgi:hypothetical protein
MKIKDNSGVDCYFYKNGVARSGEYRTSAAAILCVMESDVKNIWCLGTQKRRSRGDSRLFGYHAHYVTDPRMASKSVKLGELRLGCHTFSPKNSVRIHKWVRAVTKEAL